MHEGSASLWSLLGVGFLLGLRHATDADHLVAVSTMVARARSVRAAGLVGVTWGVGHAATLLVVGGAIVLFRLALPARLGLSLELLVALMLVVLGALNLTARGRRVAEHLGGHPPAHPEDATPPRTWRSLFVGIVHGLAGSAAVALLVLTATPSPAFAMSCLAVFGAGTILGMMLMTVLFALPLRLASPRFAHLERQVALFAGGLSIAFGVVLVYQIGFGDGLFTADPRWTPR